MSMYWNRGAQRITLKLSAVVYYIFFSCLFPAPSEAPYWCEMKNRSRHEALVSWKVMNLTVLVGGKKKVSYVLLHVWCAACYCTGIKRIIVKKVLNC